MSETNPVLPPVLTPVSTDAVPLQDQQYGQGATNYNTSEPNQVQPSLSPDLPFAPSSRTWKDLNNTTVANALANGVSTDPVKLIPGGIALFVWGTFASATVAFQLAAMPSGPWNTVQSFTAQGYYTNQFIAGYARWLVSGGGVSTAINTGVITG